MIVFSIILAVKGKF